MPTTYIYNLPNTIKPSIAPNPISLNNYDVPNTYVNTPTASILANNYPTAISSSSANNFIQP